MKTNPDWLRGARAAPLLAILAWSLSILGCSGSGGQCLNPHPLPPLCPEPLPPSSAGASSGSTSEADDASIGLAADAGAGDASAPDDVAPANAIGLDASSFDAGQCQWPDSLNDAGPGACAVARTYVACTYPAGGGCSCLSDDPTSCPECGPSTGATCRSMCGANDYAVSCGGPPQPIADGGVGFEYQSVPAACSVLAVTPGGNAYACCPCP